ncbi:hypothetical protein [Helicobacter rodentium]|uniref:hypothetical protein n=1 Tax=Helicobacter rodentium TaxID=59617 RepID=UPI0023537D9B|nr:hypothetical protein [Helicobacter rodentium]
MEVIDKKDIQIINKADNEMFFQKQEDLEKYVRERLSSISQKIEQATEKIKRAKQLANKAKDTNTGFFGGIRDIFYKGTGEIFGDSTTTQRSKLNTETNQLQNEAIEELALLTKETINFATNSNQILSATIAAIHDLIMHGFEDAHGHRMQLSKEGREQFEMIEKNLTHTLESKNKHEELSQKITEIEYKHKRQIETNRRDIEGNRKDIEANKDKIEGNRTRIQENKEKIKDLEQELDEKDILDESQSKDIKSNQESIAKLQEESQKLQEKIHQLESQVHKGKYGLFISIGATILAVVAIILNFVIKT